MALQVRVYHSYINLSGDGGADGFTGEKSISFIFSLSGDGGADGFTGESEESCYI